MKTYLVSEELLRQVLDALEQSVSHCFDQYSHNEVMCKPEHFMNGAMLQLRTLLTKEPNGSDLIAKCKEALEGTHSYYTIASGKFKPARNAEVVEAIAAIEQWEKK